MSAAQQKIITQDVLDAIIPHLKTEPNQTGIIPVKEIASEFGVKTNTVEYHIKKLVNSKYLTLLEKKGTDQQKIYQLSSETVEREAKKANDDLDMAHYKNLLAQKLGYGKQTKKEKSTETRETLPQSAQSSSYQEAPINEQKQEKKSSRKIIKTPLEEETKADVQPAQSKEKPPVKVEAETVSDSLEVSTKTITKDFTIDERIASFIKKAEKIPSHEQLLDQGDKEILSVMNQTLAQTVSYLDELKDTLSAFEQLNLLRQLIDERNKLLTQIDNVRKENDSLKQLLQEEKEPTIDPMRVRMMQQHMVDIIENYGMNTNVGLSLNLKEFQQKMFKEISGLTDYVLGLED